MSRREQPRSPRQPEDARSALSRRELLKVGGAATLATTALAASARVASAEGAAPDPDDFAELRELGAHRESYWRDGGLYFVQSNVDMAHLDEGLIRARVDGVWRDFLVREVDDAFLMHNLTMRIRMLNVMVGQAQLEMYNDAHNAAVATYGSNRGDSLFHVNVAFKGIGWVPRPERIDERTALYEKGYVGPMPMKIDVLKQGYLELGMWDRRLLGSLELYTSVDNETHTFLNQMVNPVSTLCTLADESYELRTIARLMHPADPTLTAYEQKLVKWINFAHDFFHGGPDPKRLTVHNLAVAYYVVEEFDNSPWGMTDTAGGHKRVPAG